MSDINNDTTVNSETETSKNTDLLIAQRAYDLYQQRGCAAGCDVEDWLQAEREVLSSQNAGEPMAAKEEAPSSVEVSGSASA